MAISAFIHTLEVREVNDFFEDIEHTGHSYCNSSYIWVNGAGTNRLSSKAQVRQTNGVHGGEDYRNCGVLEADIWGFPQFDVVRLSPYL